MGGLWREGHGLSVESEVLVLSSRVRRAASSLQMQTDEPAVASYGLAKAAALTLPWHHPTKKEKALVRKKRSTASRCVFCSSVYEEGLSSR